MDICAEAIQLHFDRSSIWLMKALIGFIMFGIALDLKPGDFKLLLTQPKATLTGILSQFILLPAITFLLILIMRPAPCLSLGMILVAACPGGNVSNFISHLAKGNAALSVALTGIATMLAIVMTPLNFQFWGSLLPETNALLQSFSIGPWEMFQNILLLILIPVVIGMSFNHQFPKTAAKLRKPMQIFSIIIFLAFLAVAFMGNADNFMSYVKYIALLIVLHNALAFATGFSIGKLMRLSNRDVKTITIETGIQNSALGLVLIFDFFTEMPGSGAMALIAAGWGIWHIVTGFTIATIWGRN